MNDLHDGQTYWDGVIAPGLAPHPTGWGTNALGWRPKAWDSEIGVRRVSASETVSRFGPHHDDSRNPPRPIGFGPTDTAPGLALGGGQLGNGRCAAPTHLLERPPGNSHWPTHVSPTICM
jgi:hypothetical protein